MAIADFFGLQFFWWTVFGCKDFGRCFFYLGVGEGRGRGG